MNTCSTCKHWINWKQFRGESFAGLGTCSNVMLRIVPLDCNFVTAADWGCVQHESVDGKLPDACAAHCEKMGITLP